jgi:hypothetical protein
MNETIHDQVALLEFGHERNAILEYYHGYKEALQLAFAHRKSEEDLLDENASSSAIANRHYDPLVESKNFAVEGDENFHVCTRSQIFEIEHREELEFQESHHQEIRFTYNPVRDDTCLTLASWIQTCSSFRPHYHEIL